MRRAIVVTLFVLVTALGRAPAGAQPAAPAPVAVPRSDGAPVITDGLFSPGEWDDALRVVVADAVTLQLKEHRGVVFVGVRGRVQAGIGPSELFLAAPGGPIHRLHVSAQLAEAVLRAAGPEPPPRFGLTTDWYANELRRDMELAERLEKEGKAPIDVILATTYPTDGIEFAIRRSKLQGNVWLLRLSASAFVDGRPGMIVFPPAAAERDTGGWLELRFN